MIEIAVVPDTFKPLDKGNISVPIQCILTICDLFYLFSTSFSSLEFGIDTPYS